MKLLARADARHIPLADESVHCVVTSPPYWGLRCYGVDGQIGLEQTPEEYVEQMVAVFRDVRRVLRDDGTLWLNLGDSYANDTKWGGSSGGKHVSALHGKTGIGRQKVTTGLKPKDLVGIPWRVAFALQADGWYLRSDIIWAKPNPMPESVTDRPTKAHEYVFLLSKRARYFYDAEAVREADANTDHPRNVLHRPEPSGGVMSPHAGIRKAEGRNGAGRNRRTVWTVATQPYSGAHFATFPEKLVEPCVLAGTSERGCCPECGAGWVRVVEMPPNIHPGDSGRNELSGPVQQGKRPDGKAVGTVMRERHQAGRTTTTTGWKPACECDHDQTRPCTVLDPFAGSGTTIRVANAHGRRGVGLDLNPEYFELSRSRTDGVQRRFA